MPVSKIPGPTCNTWFSMPIDGGTLCRSASPLPQPTSGLIPETLRLNQRGTPINIDVVAVHNPPGMGDFEHGNKFYKYVQERYPNVRRINNLPEMVDQVLMLAQAAGTTVQTLTIFGHGTDYYFWVGEDRISTYTLNQHRELESQFKRLSLVFNAASVVEIHACNTGEAVPLLQRLSKLMGGVAVRASTFYNMSKRSLNGDIVTCKLDMCTTDYADDDGDEDENTQ